MSSEIVEIVVEAVNNKPLYPKFNSGAVKIGEKWINVAKKVPIAQISKGETYTAEIETNAKGYQTIMNIDGLSAAKKSKSAIPELPKTAVEETKAPGGAAPVVKAGDDKLLQTLPRSTDSEKMTKKDWANKDKSIETQAVLKSVLESPAYAQLVIGKNEQDAFDIGGKMFEYFLERFYAAKG